MDPNFRYWFRAIATGLMITLSLMVLTIVSWKAIVLGAVGYLFCVQQFGAKWIERIAFLLALLAIGVWIEALPSAAEMKAFAERSIEDVRAAIRR